MEREKATQLGNAIQLRLDAKIEEEIEKISENTGLSKVEIIRQCAAAGARAIAKNNYELTLPLRMAMIGPEQKEKTSGEPEVRREGTIKGSRLS